MLCVKKAPKALFLDAQVRGFFYLVVTTSLMVAFWMNFQDHYAFFDAIRISTFNIISVLTTTGFGLDDFTSWGGLPSVIFAFLMIVGACSGSTAGGIKIFRFQIASTLLNKQMMRLIHPSGVFVQRYNHRPVNDDIAPAWLA